MIKSLGFPGGTREFLFPDCQNGQRCVVPFLSAQPCCPALLFHRGKPKKIALMPQKRFMPKKIRKARAAA